MSDKTASSPCVLCEPIEQTKESENRSNWESPCYNAQTKFNHCQSHLLYLFFRLHRTYVQYKSSITLWFGHGLLELVDTGSRQYTLSLKQETQLVEKLNTDWSYHQSHKTIPVSVLKIHVLMYITLEMNDSKLDFPIFEAVNCCFNSSSCFCFEKYKHIFYCYWLVSYHIANNSPTLLSHLQALFLSNELELVVSPKAVVLI